MGKQPEETITDTVKEVLTIFEQKAIKGEFVIVIEEKK